MKNNDACISEEQVQVDRNYTDTFTVLIARVLLLYRLIISLSFNTSLAALSTHTSTIFIIRYGSTSFSASRRIPGTDRRDNQRVVPTH